MTIDDHHGKGEYWIIVVFGASPNHHDQLTVKYRFRTSCEREAFKLGLVEAEGWVNLEWIQEGFKCSAT